MTLRFLRAVACEKEHKSFFTMWGVAQVKGQCPQRSTFEHWPNFWRVVMVLTNDLRLKIESTRENLSEKPEKVWHRVRVCSNYVLSKTFIQTVTDIHKCTASNRDLIVHTQLHTDGIRQMLHHILWMDTCLLHTCTYRPSIDQVFVLKFTENRANKDYKDLCLCPKHLWVLCDVTEQIHWAMNISTQAIRDCTQLLAGRKHKLMLESRRSGG